MAYQDVLASVADVAAAHPGRTAVADGRTTLTYAQLWQRVTRLAARLGDRGAGPDNVVAVAVERGVDLVVTQLAVLAAGAAYLPVDRQLPPSRRAFMLADCGAVLVVASSAELDPGVSDPGVPVLCLSTMDYVAPASGRSGTPGEALAYVLYTSGTSGQPKGVAVERRQLSAMLREIVATVGMTAADTVLAWTPAIFDIAAVELVAPLTVGARIEVLTDAEAVDPRSVRERMTTAGVTVVQGTPSRIGTILEAGWPRPTTVICGGEVLSRRLADQLGEQGCMVWNGYGPTEATIYATLHRVAPVAGPVPIGRPLPGVAVRVTDNSGAPVAPGDIGELWLGGEGVARGYVGREELTAERFVMVPGVGRMYRTGDRVRVRADGELDFHGRGDNQVKVHGVRIDLEEIETVLREHPAVAGAVVTAGDGDSGKRLTAHVVACGVPPSSEELRAFLAQRLLPAMIPTHVEYLTDLPLTPSGKVDRAALAAAAPARSEGGFSAPCGGWENRLARLWCEVLRLDRVSRDVPFVEAGGDSLTLMRLAARLAREGIPIGLPELLDHRTVAEQGHLAALRVGDELPVPEVR
jgi:amino acid adenylation domain-containing protein